MGIDDIFPFLFIGGIIIVVLFSVVANSIAEKKRRQSLEKTANDLGLDFQAEGSSELLSELSEFPLFSKGRSKRIRNVILADTEEVAMSIFDFQYTTGGGKNSHTYRQSVALFRSHTMRLPRLALRPQSMFHSIGKMFGYDDIDFESHPAFSKSFILQADDEDQVRKLFSAELLSFLEQKPGINIEANGNQLTFCRPAKRAKPEQVRELMSEGLEVFNQFRNQAVSRDI